MRTKSANAPGEFASFGDLLKFLRRRAGLTQRELSIAVGYSDSQLSRMEQNQRVPDAATLRARFVPALLLDDEPALAERLLELAAAARHETQPASDTTEARHPRHNLPAQLTSFVGRGRQLTEIADLLHQPGTRLVTLTGPGGIGKTRLALRAAETLLDRYPHGAWLVELAPLGDAAFVLPAVAQALGVRESANRTLVQALEDYLRAKALLLVLDNCEHLVDACARLATDLLRGAPRLTILATSREALGTTGERLYSVAPLALPTDPGEVDVETLARSEAGELFTRRAKAARLGFALSAANAPTVAQVCRRLDGIPLALELAAARLSALPIETIAARLDDRFRVLVAGSRTSPPRHQTLRAMIDWSHDLLSEPEQRVFRRLSVFAGGWTLEAAEAVCADEYLDGWAVVEHLAGLVNKSLAELEAVADGQAGRYRMLETVRQYAVKKLVAAGELETTRARHLEHYLQLSEKAEPYFWRREELEWLARLTTEQGNLRAALEWSIATLPHRAVQMTANLWGFWSLHDHWTEGRRWLRSSLEAVAGLPPSPKQARAMFGLAMLMTTASGAREQQPLLEATLHLARKLDDEWTACEALCHQANWVMNQGHFEQAEDQIVEALQLAEHLNAPYLLGQAIGRHADLAFLQGDMATAKARGEQELAYFVRTGERAATTGALYLLVLVACRQGDYARAAELARQEVVSAREIGVASHLAGALLSLGGVVNRLGDLAEARVLYEEALVHARHVANPYPTLACLNMLGLIASTLGDCAGAEAMMAESTPMTARLDEPARWADNLLFRGLSAYFCGDLSRAESLLTESLAKLRAIDAWDRLGLAYHGLALTYYAQGHFELAERLTTKGQAISVDLTEQRAPLLHVQARLALQRGDHAEAAVHFRESLDLRVKMGAKRGVAESLEGLADLAARLGQGERAARLFGAAEALREMIAAPIPPPERAEYERAVAQTRDMLAAETFTQAWTAGRALPWEQAAALALEG